MPEIQNPESIAIVARVQEIIDEGKSKTTQEVDSLLTKFRTEMLGAINQVAAGMKAPAAQPNGHAGNGQAAPAVPAAVHEAVIDAAAKDKEGMRRVIEKRIYGALGLPTWEPVQVPFTKDQALAAVASGQPTLEVLSVAERGLSAIGIEAAYERQMVQAPKKGLSTWQVVGLAVAGTVATGGAVAAGLYLAEVGPFAPKALPTDGGMPPTEG